MKLRKIVLLILVVGLLATALMACAPATPTPEAGKAVPVDRETVTTTFEFQDDGSAFAWPDALQGVMLLIILVSLVWGYYDLFLEGYPEAGSKSRHRWAKVFAMVGIAGYLFFAGLQVVTPTNVGVIRQSFPNVGYRVVGPGTHWATPFVSRVNRYTTRIRPMKIYDIQADTNTTGRPEIYPDVVIWFRLPVEEGKELELTQLSVPIESMKLLDLRYGPDYEKVLVKEAAINAVKSVSGAHPYDYFGVHKKEAQDEIKTELQAKLGGLVEVTDVAISFFNYSPEFEAQLKTQAEKRLQLEAAQMDVEIAAQLEEKAANEGKAKVAAAEAQKKAEILKAEGDSQARILRAQADAKALELIRQQIASDPNILTYEAIQRWQGDVPSTLFTNEAGAQPPFFFQQALPTSTPTPQPTP